MLRLTGGTHRAVCALHALRLASSRPAPAHLVSRPSALRPVFVRLQGPGGLRAATAAATAQKQGQGSQHAAAIITTAVSAPQPAAQQCTHPWQV